jgi:hypothetical protein
MSAAGANKKKRHNSTLSYGASQFSRLAALMAGRDARAPG